MTDTGTATPPVPPPANSPAMQLQAALDRLNHPANLDLNDRLHALQNATNVMAAALLPLLPIE